jgi:restriction system protein
MVILQDWTATEDMDKPFDFSSLDHRLGYKPTSPTFVNLKSRLHDHFCGTKLDDVYVTNLFPFIKVGGLRASISSSALLDAAEQYALPQIAIVQPLLVIALGINTFWALAKKLGQEKPPDRLKDALNGSPVQGDGYQVWCQGHTAVDIPRGLKNVNVAWARMAEWYKREQKAQRSCVEFPSSAG